MHKITIQELVEFNRKTSEKSKRNFANKLKTRLPKEKKEKKEGDKKDGGGDYWVTSTSCICNVIKHNSNRFYEGKIEDLRNKIEGAEIPKTKTMHRANVEILSSFRDFNHEDTRPEKIAKFERVQSVQKIYPIDNFPIYLNPNLVFSFDENGKKHVGAIWLIAKIQGFSKAELGMFCELLYKFLDKNYSQTHQISEKFCTAIDTYGAQSITYADMLTGKTPFLINKTINELKS